MIPIPKSPDSNEEYDGSAAVWGFLLALFFFKLATVVIVFWHMRTWEAGVILWSTFWYWFPPLILFGAGPVLFYVRLRRIRKRRDALHRSEWMIEDRDAVATAQRERWN